MATNFKYAYLGWFYNDRLDDMLKMLQEVTSHFDDLVEQNLDDIKGMPHYEESELSKWDAGKLEDYLVERKEEVHTFGKSYPEYIRRIVFLSAQSYLETELNNICDRLRVSLNKKIKLKDLGERNYIKRSIYYLQKVIELDISLEDVDFQTIRKYQEVRNKFTHNEGRLINMSPEARITFQNDNVNPFDGLVLSERENRIIIEDNSFVNNYVELIRKVIKIILSKIMTQLP